MSEEHAPKPVLTKKDINRTAARWIFSAVNTFNFQSQQAGSVIWSLNPSLRKIYENDDDYLEALNSHYKYYNCMPWLSGLVLGAALAIEDNGGIKDKDMIQNFKTSLMGPLSGVGDTVFWVLIPTILGSIAGYMALQYNPVGIVAWILINAAFIYMRLCFFHIGYRQGLKLYKAFDSKLTLLTESCSILGLIVVGSLISSVVNVQIPYVIKIGEVGMEIQPMLDKILPSMVPVFITFSIYKLIKTRKIGISGILFLIILFCMAGAFFGFLS